ncbi:hypothetical protein ABZ568_04430 [Streptomyces olindensis]|uniref:Putative antitoxin VapB45-like DNA-binding HTH domain-containing protein n=1 Tax=Streptomyces olindensis TaxID=358823 RepID=A0ABV2XP14_9ACTN
MVDRFRDGLLTPTETASYLEIPQSTLHSWLKGRAAGAPLVHRVEPLRKGQPSVPFIAVAEAHVLRSLRSLGLRTSEIREAAAAVRDAFATPYGLVSERIATDGVDIFVEPGLGDLRRARDGQTPIQPATQAVPGLRTRRDRPEVRARNSRRGRQSGPGQGHHRPLGGRGDRAVGKAGPAAYAVRRDRVERTGPP